MKREQVFVRGVTKDGNWDAIDVLNLDNASFRAFVIDVMLRAGLLVGIQDEYVEGLSIVYREEKDVEV